MPGVAPKRVYPAIRPTALTEMNKISIKQSLSSSKMHFDVDVEPVIIRTKKGYNTDMFVRKIAIYFNEDCGVVSLFGNILKIF